MENKKAVGTGMPEIVVIGAAIMDVLARPADEAVFRTGSSPMEDMVNFHFIIPQKIFLNKVILI